MDDRRRSAVAAGAGGTILALALVRAMAIQSPLPFWDADPLTVYTPIGGSGSGLVGVLTASLTGIGPTWSVLLDGLTLIAAGVAMWASPPGGGRGRMIATWVASGLATIGSVGIAIHAMGHGGMGLEHARIGLAWLAAIWGAIGLWRACGDRRTRGLLAGVLVSFVVVLAAKGLIQILIEHPRTVASFEADKRAFFESKGWAPDSSNARAYERRLRQSEATGWFGLANVYASFCAASCIAAAGVLVLARRSAAPRGRASGWRVPAILTAVGLAATIASGSIGGMAALAVGGALALGLFALAQRSPAARAARVRRLMPAVFVGVFALPIFAVIAQGIVGPGLSHLSVLFRWFYLVGAGRVFWANPLVGVGPAGFQSAYAMSKPAMSPEDVTSPHSILADYGAMLGLFGVALGAIVVLAVWRLGCAARASLNGSDSEPARPTRMRVYASAAIAGGAFFIGLWMERGASMPLVIGSGLSPVDPTPVPALLAGLLATLGLAAIWVLLAERLWAIFEAREGAHFGLAAGALVIAIHAQIEMTPVQPASAALFWAWLGIGAAMLTADGGAERQPRGAAGLIGLVPGALGLVVLGGIVPGVASWESRLADAARLAAPVGDMRTELRSLMRVNPVLRRDRMADLAERVAAELGGPVAPEGRAIESALDRLAQERGERAELILDESHDGLGGVHPPTVRAQIRLLRGLAEGAEGPASMALLDRALERAERLAEEHPTLASGWSLVGQVHADLSLFSDPAEHLRLAREAWEREMAVDPHSLGAALRLMDASMELGDDAAGAAWARRALAIDEAMRLDPLKRMTEQTRSRVARAGGKP